jgi:hypothetical protein
MSSTIDVNNLVEIRQAGLKALRDALEPVGTVSSIQQYENGSGNYTKEKYQQPELTIEEIDLLLKNNKQELN